MESPSGALNPSKSFLPLAALVMVFLSVTEKHLIHHGKVEGENQLSKFNLLSPDAHTRVYPPHYAHVTVSLLQGKIVISGSCPRQPSVTISHHQSDASVCQPEKDGWRMRGGESNLACALTHRFNQFGYVSSEPQRSSSVFSKARIVSPSSFFHSVSVIKTL